MKFKFSLPITASIALGISIQNAIAQIYTPSNRIPVADSTMNTQVSGGVSGDAGKISIDTAGNIEANAVGGNGGRVSIPSQGLLGN